MSPTRPRANRIAAAISGCHSASRVRPRPGTRHAGGSARRAGGGDRRPPQAGAGTAAATASPPTTRARRICRSTRMSGHHHARSHGVGAPARFAQAGWYIGRLCDGRSARDGEVVFVVPDTLAGAGSELMGVAVQGLAILLALAGLAKLWRPRPATEALRAAGMPAPAAL